MKIKEGYMLREVAGSFVVVPLGKASLDFNGMITLNEMGAFLWKQLEQGCTEEELLEAVLAEYEVTEERAKSGIEKFLDKVRDGRFVEE